MTSQPSGLSESAPSRPLDPVQNYLASSAVPFADEINLLSRLIYLNKNQHKASIWFRKALEALRWSRRIHRLLLNPPDLLILSIVLDQFQSRLLRSYDSIIQNLARTAFMASGMVFIASFARLHSIIRCVQTFCENLNTHRSES